MKTKQIYISLLILLIIGVAYYCHNWSGSEKQPASSDWNEKGSWKVKTDRRKQIYVIANQGLSNDRDRAMANEVYRRPTGLTNTKAIWIEDNPDKEKTEKTRETIAGNNADTEVDVKKLDTGYQNASNENTKTDKSYKEKHSMLPDRNVPSGKLEEKTFSRTQGLSETVGTKEEENSDPDETDKTAECSDFEPSQKFDCHPEAGANEKTCQSRGCCWFADPKRRKPIVAGENDTQTPVDVPYCYFPRNYPGYSITETKETDLGFRSYLMKNSLGYYPGEVKLLTMDVMYETNNILHIKMTDARNQRFEVPTDIPKATRKAPNPSYKVYISKTGSPFALTVKRKGETVDRTIFSTKDTAPLMYTDQYLQLSSALPTPYIYGLGERRGDLMMNVNWTRHTIWARDQGPKENANLYGAHPFYMVMEEGGDSHGFFLLNSNAMDVILQPYPAITWRTIGGILDFYIFLGPTPKDVTRQYTYLIGKPFMPPYWSLGFHICRWGYKNVSDTLAVVDGMRKAGIPQDTQWNDIDYMKGRKDFMLDPENFGNQADMVKTIHSYGMKYIVIVDPGIAIDEPKGSYEALDLGLKLDVFLKNDSGQNLIGRVWPGNTVFPDFTHPNAQEYWTTVVSHFIDQLPVDGLWIDMNEISSFAYGSIEGCPKSKYDEPPYLPAVQKGTLYDHSICASAMGFISREYDIHNLYGFKETNATYNALRSKLGIRPFVISRSTYSGQGHFGGHWTGDNVATYHDLYRSVSEILSMNLFGIPMVGADICGFSENTTYQLCLRWHQLGAFYPFSRNHNNYRAMSQEPFRFDATFSKAVREVYLTRYSLLPYLYTLFYFSHIYGDTVARPMFQEFPLDKNTYAIDTQFMWGSSLLIAPVLLENAETVAVYLPDKTNWYDFYKGTSYDGGHVTTLYAPMEKLNLLMQGGSIIPMQNPGQTTTASRLNDFVLLGAYCNQQTGYGVMYWDDGESLDTYERKAYNLIEFHLNKTTLYSKVISAGYLPKTPMSLGSITLYGVEMKPAAVSLNDKPQQFFYDAELKVLKIPSINPKVNLLQEFQLQLAGQANLSGIKKSNIQSRRTETMAETEQVRKEFYPRGQQMGSEGYKLNQGLKSHSETKNKRLTLDQYLNKDQPGRKQDGMQNQVRIHDQGGVNTYPKQSGQGVLPKQGPYTLQAGKTSKDIPTIGLLGSSKGGQTISSLVRERGQLASSSQVRLAKQVSNFSPVGQAGLLSSSSHSTQTKGFPDSSQGKHTGQLPTSNQGGLTGHLPSSNQGKLTGKFPSSNQGRLTGQLPGSAQGGMTGQLPSSNQGRLAGQLPSSNQDGQKGQLPGSEQRRMTGQLPSSNQDGLAGQLPRFKQGGLIGQLPSSNQGRQNGQLPGSNQGKLTDQLLGSSQSKKTGQLPSSNQGQLIGRIPSSNQGKLINQVPSSDQHKLTD